MTSVLRPTFSILKEKHGILCPVRSGVTIIPRTVGDIVKVLLDPFTSLPHVHVGGSEEDILSTFSAYKPHSTAVSA